eukprot:15356698-Ditylum_brightwellii.AAC.1
MDHLLDSPYAAAEEQEEMNYCRLYLHASLLSHIATSDGKQVRKECFNPKEIPEEIKFKQEYSTWPNQIKPYEKIWKKWRTALTKMICNLYGLLHQPLGPWKKLDQRQTIRGDEHHVYK